VPGLYRLHAMDRHARCQLQSIASTALQALDEGVTQVVCIAAGYDTRAYRFARQGVKAS